MSNGIDIKLVFKNNSADVAGSVLYGGTIDNCKLPGLDSHSFGEVLDMLYSTTMTLIITQLQTSPLTDFAYAHVNTTFQTVVSFVHGITVFHILVKHFKFL